MGSKGNKGYMGRGEWDEVDQAFLSEPPKHYRTHKDFVSLIAWQRCREVRNFIYTQVISHLPSEEKFDLGSQLRRAAQSITLNIAEGYGRYHYKEAIQFYRISRGSLYELKDALIIAFDLHYINQTEFEQGTELIEQAKIALNGYIGYVKRQSEK